MTKSIVGQKRTIYKILSFAAVLLLFLLVLGWRSANKISNNCVSTINSTCMVVGSGYTGIGMPFIYFGNSYQIPSELVEPTPDGNVSNDQLFFHPVALTADLLIALILAGAVSSMARRFLK